MFINCCTLSSWIRNSNSICCLSNHVVEQKPMDIHWCCILGNISSGSFVLAPSKATSNADALYDWLRWILGAPVFIQHTRFENKGDKRYVVTTCYDKTWPKLNCGKNIRSGLVSTRNGSWKKNKKNDDGDDDDEDKEEEEANQEEHTKKWKRWSKRTSTSRQTSQYSS